MVPGAEARGLVASKRRVKQSREVSFELSNEGRRARAEKGGEEMKKLTSEHDSSGLDDVLSLPSHADDGSSRGHPLDCKVEEEGKQESVEKDSRGRKTERALTSLEPFAGSSSCQHSRAS